jgi:phage internal scaffolding protein
MEIRNAYTKQKRNAFKPTGESLTQQHHVEQVKIQNIIKRYDKTGILDHVARGVAHYGDYTKINEYKTYLDFVNSANESFAGLPSDIREKFSNDAGAFFEFATDPKNKEAMINMGLFPAPERTSEKTKAPKVSPQPSETTKSSSNEDKSE